MAATDLVSNPAVGSLPTQLHVAGAHRPRWLPKAALRAADSLAVALGMLGAFALVRPGAPAEHLRLSVIAFVVWVCAAQHFRIYDRQHVTARLEEVRRLVYTTATAYLGLTSAGFAVAGNADRGWALVAFVGSLAFVIGERTLARGIIRRLRLRGQFQQPVLVVGANDEARSVARSFASDPGLGYNVVGFVDDERSLTGGHLPPVLGRVEQAINVARRHDVSGILIATTAVSAETANRLARRALDAGFHVEMTAGLRDVAPQRLTVHPIGRFAVVHVRPVARSGWRIAAKRAFDIVGATVGLVLTAPVLLVAAAAIKLDSRGPVLFRQQRVGRRAVQFEILKLRTMVADAESLLVDLRDANEAGGPLFKATADPRITRVGRVLRRLSIDELPQFWNVLRGEMSLVGPRPALPSEVAGWRPELHQRVVVKPGITGMWQVARKPDWSFDDYVRLDLAYVDNWSLLTDIAICAKTLTVVGRGNR